jgi:hypothetical protein
VSSRQRKQVEQQQMSDDHADADFAEATARRQLAAEKTKRRLEEQGEFGQPRSGNPFDQAWEDNPGKWVKQLLLRSDAEERQFVEQLTKEYAKRFPSGDTSNVELRANWLHKKFDCFYSKQNLVKRYRALDSAQARDRIDRAMAQMKEEAHRLKKTDEDFQDVDLLAHTLAPVVEALEEYEKMAKLTFIDVHPLNALANALPLAFYLGRIMGPMTKNREEMARLREKKVPSVQTKNRVIEAHAKQFRERDPKRSLRSMALTIGPKVGLKVNTVEKKLADMGF